MWSRWFSFGKRSVSRTLDARLLEELVGRKPGFSQRLGDAGDYLRDLFHRHRELTVSAVEKRVRELKKYRRICYEKIDEHTAEQGRTYRHLQAIRQRLQEKTCPPWERTTLIAKAEEEMFAYRHFGATLKQWQRNVRMATLLVSYLDRLVAMMVKPMKEGELEAWSVEFQLQVEKEGEFLEKIKDFQTRSLSAEPHGATEAAAPPAEVSPPASLPESQPELPEQAGVIEELDRLLEQ